MDVFVALSARVRGFWALEMSPPSIVMRSLPAPSSWRKVLVEVRRRGAVRRTSLLSMMRRADSAEALAWTLRPLMATS